MPVLRNRTMLCSPIGSTIIGAPRRGDPRAPSGAARLLGEAARKLLAHERRDLRVEGAGEPAQLGLGNAADGTAESALELELALLRREHVVQVAQDDFGHRRLLDLVALHTRSMALQHLLDPCVPPKLLH